MNFPNEQQKQLLDSLWQHRYAMIERDGSVFTRYSERINGETQVIETFVMPYSMVEPLVAEGWLEHKQLWGTIPEFGVDFTTTGQAIMDGHSDECKTELANMAAMTLEQLFDYAFASQQADDYDGCFTLFGNWLAIETKNALKERVGLKTTVV